MSGLSLRARLAIAFALAMGVVLAAIAVFLYLRLGTVLDEQVERRLRADATAVSTAFVSGAAPLQAALAEGDVAQVIDARGEVVAAPSDLREPLLVPPDLVAARTRDLTFERSGVIGDDPARFLAMRLDTSEPRAVLVVGTSLESRNDAVDGLLTQLLVGIPFAIGLASLSGYVLAGVALRPVEAMRERAASISVAAPEARLPLPRAQDEIRRLGETLNAMLARLEEGLSRERRFVADASHEIRTPLALLRTELDLALRRPRSHDELESALRSASVEVERLTRLADDLLLLARADEQQLAAVPERVPAVDLCESVASRFRSGAAADGRPIEIDCPDSVAVDGDRAQLERALGNLVDNGLRHGDGTVRLSATREGDLVVLGVSDSGAGFPDSYLPVAFERFTQADAARTQASSGLGLAIVAAIAGAHSGEARVRNADGGGAIAELVLPAAGQG